MKLTKGIRTYYTVGYKLWEMEADIRNRGRIPIVWQEEEGCQVEGATSFIPNVVSTAITVRQKLWYVVGA